MTPHRCCTPAGRLRRRHSRFASLRETALPGLRPYRWNCLRLEYVRRVLPILCIVPVLFPMAAAADKNSENSVRTSFAIIVGFPAAATSDSSGVLLVPGTVIPLEADRLASEESDKAELVGKSHAFSAAVTKLWSTFRLDPARSIQKGMRTSARVGAPVDLPELEGANVRMTATLLGYSPTSTTFRVVFTQGQKQLADSTVNVTRGGRAVVGGTDGDAAPYIFVFVEPATAAEGTASTEPKLPGVTQPVLIRKGMPAYPPEARKNRVMGNVLVDVIVGTNGKVEDARAIEYPDESLAQAAIESIREWEFQPAHDEKGNPLRVKATIQVNFVLK